ncbi:MAG: DUF1643 domain-containing protein [Bacteroidota bacterium]|jgi:hypothetical protein|nr:DUF1643 domain-containing protein [Flavobacteriaceae bacterium]MEC7185833.1 DUF1643 domain-containing protein [Bacteroidota bacterium]MEC8611621.1 DUF1643 domain-containing protein [Bacteroidota bacterium]|tara:strand:- start:202 stop:654 length:453 start_codon:yes stop_codon:yes gene_type:complete
MIREAKISIDKKERYSLKREWDKSKNKILYIMLNPSLADDNNDDPTIRRLINFSKKFNYGGFLVGNIYSTISPNPKEVDKSDGISDKNLVELLKLINQVEEIVYAWGNNAYEPEFLKDLVSNPKCFGKNLNGSPKHPLYLPKNIQLISYR